MEPLLLGIPEVKRLCGIGRTTIYERLRSGDLVAVKCGRRTLITSESVHAFVESLVAGAVQ